MIIERTKSIVATTYDGEDLHILFIDVRTTELQQTLETDIYCRTLPLVCVCVCVFCVLHINRFSYSNY